MKKIIVAFSILFILIIGGFIWKDYFWTGRICCGIPNLTGPATADYKDAAYQIEGEIVKLTNGLAEKDPSSVNVGGSGGSDSATRLVTRYFGNEISGDFNEDGFKDAAFFLTQEAGGSGTFFYAAVALGSADGYLGTNAVFLGDRISPQPVEWRDGQLIFNYADRAEGEPITARTSIGVSKYFQIKDSQLEEVEK
ncbi:MAG: hypothetical protein Q8L36_00175 [bacterium]|nr:hypothetical protein [bacterium]